MIIRLRDIYYNSICSTYLIPNWIRKILFVLSGIKIDKGSVICPKCFIGNSKLHIGKNTFVNYNVWFNTTGGIFIGNNCNIAFGVKFITSSHEVGNANRRAGTSYSKPIVVGNGVWIGANAIILPNVTIGDAVIIAAGSVVIHDCEDNCLYAGNPAKKIKIISSLHEEKDGQN